MNFDQVKNFITHIKGRMKPDAKYCLMASDMHFSFSINNQESVFVVPYHDQEHYYKTSTLIRNDKLGKHLCQLMKISGNEHLIEDIQNTL